MTTHGVAPFPLYWPLSQPRMRYRRHARFETGFVQAREHMLHALQLLGASSVVLSSNIPLRRDGLPGVPDREPQDPGVAVYFLRPVQDANGRTEKKPYVIACDTFQRVTHNLRAIGLTVEALRSIARYGATSMLEQAFSGFAALPPAGGSSRPWRDVLGVANGVSVDAVKLAYRELARQRHPDSGGSNELMVELNGAYERALRELGASS